MNGTAFDTLAAANALRDAGFEDRRPKRSPESYATPSAPEDTIDCATGAELLARVEGAAGHA